MASTEIHEWQPAAYALGTSEYPNPMILLILNQPINDLRHFQILHGQALLVVCADGGANRIHDLPIQYLEKCHDYPPDVVCGDMDSLRPEVEEFFSQNERTKFYKDDDQYSTDFTKSLKHIKLTADSNWFRRTWLRRNFVERGETPIDFERRVDDHEMKERKMPPVDVVILGGLGGRVDQAFSQIHHLYAASDLRSSRIGNTYLVSAENITFLLEKGVNRILTPTGPGLLTENVGIIPIGKPSIITTRGLEWDITDWSTEFGGQISTSNHIRAETVQVETTEKVLFTVELAPREHGPGLLASFVKKSA